VSASQRDNPVEVVALVGASLVTARAHADDAEALLVAVAARAVLVSD
jgi:hypothetical protein